MPPTQRSGPKVWMVGGGFGVLDSRHVFCLRCVERAFGGTRGVANPMWRENHIYIVEESEQCFPLLEVVVKHVEGSLFPAFCLQNFVGLAIVVVPNVCGCGGKKWSNKGQASVGPLHLRECL